jgi:hypothetical protein
MAMLASVACSRGACEASIDEAGARARSLSCGAACLQARMHATPWRRWYCGLHEAALSATSAILPSHACPCITYLSHRPSIAHACALARSRTLDVRGWVHPRTRRRAGVRTSTVAFVPLPVSMVAPTADIMWW